MNDFVCKNCKSELYTVKLDSRGVAEARCADCDTYIKKLNTAEVVAYYENKIKDIVDANTAMAEDANAAKAEKQICPACTEHYFMRQGRLGTIYKPIIAHYCPKCGRELKDTDRDY